MGYQLKNRLDVAIEYEVSDGQYIELPLAQGTTLTELYMVESTKLSVPTLYVQIEDGLKYFTQYALLDGRRIAVSLSINGQPLVQSRFRIFGFSSNYNGKTTTYKIDGYLDCPLYWFGTSCNCYNGTSSYVISEVARLCGLNAYTDQTHDSQLWAQGNMTYNDFVSYVVKHGYRNNNSYMVRCLWLDKSLLYKDVNSITTPTANVIANSSKDGYFTCTDLNIKANSGLNNASGGYASIVQTSDITGDNLYNKLTVNKGEAYLNTNQQINSQIKRGVVQYGYISPNMNENYWLGTYQNFRYAKLYNVDCAMIINNPSSLRPLSAFNLVANDTEDTMDTSDSGLYIVDTRTICIKGVTYAERINATRKGVN